MKEKNCDIIDMIYNRNENKLEQEIESGNIEYKLRLDKKNDISRKKMINQMLWRINEGKKINDIPESHYILGVNDDGSFSNFSLEESERQTNIFEEIIGDSNGDVKIKDKHIHRFESQIIVHIVVGKIYEKKYNYIPEINVAILGNPSSGKTSLVSRLVHGQRDDGNGFSRKIILRHNHEKTSGETSSIKFETIGFNGDELINYGIGIDYGLEEIFENSNKIINVIDLPGRDNFLKTILNGIMSIEPDHIIICLGIDIFLNDEEKYISYFKICELFNIKPTIVITKCDLISSNSYEKIKNECIQKLGINEDIISKLIFLSNITDYGYNEIIDELKKIKSPQQNEQQKSSIFVINDVFNVPNVGKIYHGIVKSGTIKTGEIINVINNGKAFKMMIKTIHRKSIDVDKLGTGMSGSITLKKYIHENNKFNLEKISLLVNNEILDYLTDKIRIECCGEEQINEKQYRLFTMSQMVDVNVSTNYGEIIGEVCDMEKIIICEDGQKCILKGKKEIITAKIYFHK
jgi:GTPase